MLPLHLKHDQFSYFATQFSKYLIVRYIYSVALNYQSEGRVLQLNRAKFYSNGNCGYILKPACMCEGLFRKYSYRQFMCDLCVLFCNVLVLS